MAEETTVLDRKEALIVACLGLLHETLARIEKGLKEQRPPAHKLDLEDGAGLPKEHDPDWIKASEALASFPRGARAFTRFVRNAYLHTPAGAVTPTVIRFDQVLSGGSAPAWSAGRGLSFYLGALEKLDNRPGEDEFRDIVQFLSVDHRDDAVSAVRSVAQHGARVVGAFTGP